MLVNKDLFKIPPLRNMELLEILWKMAHEYAEGTRKKLPKATFYFRNGAYPISGHLTGFDPRSGLFTVAQEQSGNYLFFYGHQDELSGVAIEQMQEFLYEFSKGKIPPQIPADYVPTTRLRLLNTVKTIQAEFSARMDKEIPVEITEIAQEGIEYVYALDLQLEEIKIFLLNLSEDNLSKSAFLEKIQRIQIVPSSENKLSLEDSKLIIHGNLNQRGTVVYQNKDLGNHLETLI